MEREKISELVKAAQNSDNSAFEKLYKDTFKGAYFVAFKITGNEHDAMDIVQDSYIKAMQRLGQLTDTGSFVSWLNTIVANTAKTYVCKKKPMLFADNGNDDDSGTGNEFEKIEDEDSDFIPEESLDTQEAREAVREIIDSLPEDKRLCVLMYYGQEMTTAQIAKTLEISENTVKTRLFDSKKKIKTKIEALRKAGATVLGSSAVPYFVWMLKRYSTSITVSEKSVAAGFTAITSGGAVAAGTAAATTAGMASTAVGTAATATAAGAAAGAGASAGAASAAGAAATAGVFAKVAAAVTVPKIVAAVAAAAIVVGGTATGVKVAQNKAANTPITTTEEEVTQFHGAYPVNASESQSESSAIDESQSVSVDVSQLLTNSSTDLSVVVGQTTAKPTSATAKATQNVTQTTAKQITTAKQTTAKQTTANQTTTAKPTTTQSQTTATTAAPTTTQPTTTAAPTTTAPTTTAAPTTTEPTTLGSASATFSVLDTVNHVVGTFNTTIPEGTLMNQAYLVNLVIANGYPDCFHVLGDAVGSTAQAGQSYSFEAEIA